VGFAFAGLIASAFQLVANRPPSFRLIAVGGLAGVAALPLVILAAPVIILRNTLRGRRFERRPIPFVAVATIIACLWSLGCGAMLIALAGALIG
jgi:hypothetical protein